MPRQSPKSLADLPPVSEEEYARLFQMIAMSDWEKKARAGRAPLEYGGGGALSPPRPANDPNALSRGPDPTYGGAVQQQIMQKHIKPGEAQVGDYWYWNGVAKKGGHYGTYEGEKVPNATLAAKESSRGGRTSVMIDSNGNRTVFKDGELVASDSWK